MPAFELQPILANEKLVLLPLAFKHFDELFAAAADPLIWVQHPNADRYQLVPFKRFFNGAIQSGGAFIIKEKNTGEVIGSSRFYDFNPQADCITIGYTFISRKFWGKGFNANLKNLMINHAFKFVNQVIFQVGATNYRSQKAVEKIGAKKINEISSPEVNQPQNGKIIYAIKKANWLSS